MPPPAHTPIVLPQLPDELISLVDTISRIQFDLESYQVPQLAACRGPATLHDQLAGDIRAEMGGVRRDLEELKLQVDDLDKARDRRAGLELIERAQHRLNLINSRYRDAVITSKKLIQSVNASLSPREQLLRSASPVNGHKGRATASETNASADDALMSATTDVTEGLRRTLQLMQQELDRSLISNELLQSQTSTMQMTSDQYSTFSTLLTTSKALITSLEQADMLDRLILLFAFIFFCLCCAWIIKRRVLDKGLRVAGAVGRVVAGGKGSSPHEVVERAVEDVRDAISVLTTTATLVASSFLAARTPSPPSPPPPAPTPSIEAIIDAIDEDSFSKIVAPVGGAPPRDSHSHGRGRGHGHGHGHAAHAHAQAHSQHGAIPQGAAYGGGSFAFENRTVDTRTREEMELDWEEEAVQEALERGDEPPVVQEESAIGGEGEEEAEADKEPELLQNNEAYEAPDPSPLKEVELESLLDEMDDRAFDDITAPVGLAFADFDDDEEHEPLDESMLPLESSEELEQLDSSSASESPEVSPSDELPESLSDDVSEPIAPAVTDRDDEEVITESLEDSVEAEAGDAEMEEFLDAMDDRPIVLAANTTDPVDIPDSTLPLEDQDHLPFDQLLSDPDTTESSSGEEESSLRPTPAPELELFDELPPPDVSSDDPDEVVGSQAGATATALPGSEPTSEPIAVTTTEVVSPPLPFAEPTETLAIPEPIYAILPDETSLHADVDAPLATSLGQASEPEVGPEDDQTGSLGEEGSERPDLDAWLELDDDEEPLRASPVEIAPEPLTSEPDEDPEDLDAPTPEDFLPPTPEAEALPHVGEDVELAPEPTEAPSADHEPAAFDQPSDDASDEVEAHSHIPESQESGPLVTAELLLEKLAGVAPPMDSDHPAFADDLEAPLDGGFAGLGDLDEDEFQAKLEAGFFEELEDRDASEEGEVEYEHDEL
ncbi:hypothetical protein RQP46_000425 [Phenoliferia psychrophenolica]